MDHKVSQASVAGRDSTTTARIGQTDVWDAGGVHSERAYSCRPRAFVGVGAAADIGERIDETDQGAK